MRTIVVYESMYGNTRQVAEAIARGIDPSGGVRALPVSKTGEINPGELDLLVVGGPTHAHGMSRESTRNAARTAATGLAGDLPLDPDATGEGIREWLASFSGVGGKAAAFDTRFDATALLTGRASKGISRWLRKAGFELAAAPESFLVDKATHLLAGEEQRAQAWGASLGVTPPDAWGDSA
ncbi:flavodoxin [Arthrobacter sp. AQ5-05]|uniref:flavodoxin family protein n=1 Tax=Arthrobacter sp. AQ5-05 TaxID=2184581 RepID=UPI000DCC17D3|nr:flavodoxin domain-containing protein [Arthrobacter sp. AQ5-05]RAX48672.1 flavodoxin [Arthrobacter sp. AQ5-05]